MQQFNSLTIEQYNNKRGLTLVELLIAVCIFALIVIGFSSIDTFSHYHVMSSDRRAKLQNDASYVLEHMAKEISKAIGDVNQTTVDTSGISGDAAVKVWIDGNPYSIPPTSPNGRRDAYPTDCQIAYRFRGATTGEIWYCPECTNDSCTACNPSWGDPSHPENILSKRVSSFSPIYSSGNDYVEIQLTACWNPAVTCGTLDNPQLTMKNRIYMPAVSTH